MNTYKISVTVDESKQVVLADLPFTVGQKLQVTIVPDESEANLDENAKIDIAIEPNMEFPVWSPYDCYEAADTMLKVLRATKANNAQL